MTRRSDSHRIPLTHAGYLGVLVELSRLWDGTRLRWGRHYVEDVDGALHDYVADLLHCFPRGPVRGGIPR